MSDDIDFLINQALKKNANGGGTRLRAGKYTLGLTSFSIKATFKSTYAIVEVVVEKSEPNEEGVAPNLVGSTASILFDMKSLSGPGDFKKFMLALDGVEQIPDGAPGSAEQQAALKRLAANLMSPSNPGAGFLVNAVSFTRPIKSGANAGKPFTGFNYKHVPANDGNDPASVAARAAKYKAAAPAPA